MRGPAPTSSPSAACRRDGVVVVVRPDQYVAAVLPLSATDELAAFFAQSLVDQTGAGLVTGSPVSG